MPLRGTMKTLVRALVIGLLDLGRDRTWILRVLGDAKHWLRENHPRFQYIVGSIAE